MARERGTHAHCCWKYKPVKPLWLSVQLLLKSLRIEFPWDAESIPLKGSKSMCHRDPGPSMFTAALFIVERIWNQHTCPSTAEWIVKIWIIHKMEFYSAPKIKRNVQVNGWKLKLQ